MDMGGELRLDLILTLTDCLRPPGGIGVSDSLLAVSESLRSPPGVRESLRPPRGVRESLRSPLGVSESLRGVSELLREPGASVMESFRAGSGSCVGLISDFLVSTGFKNSSSLIFGNSLFSCSLTLETS